ncbi:MAG TPA: LacI family DNA-binding transcriptional regulator [Actinopolymorphaceae bacterium]
MTTATPSGSRRRPTIEDVAQAAGVSKGTVSRALNGKRWVSPMAQQAVERAVRKTGYRANASAKALKSGRTRSVAFLLGDQVGKMFADPNIPVLINGVSEALAAEDMSMLLLLCATAEERRRAVEFVKAGHVDGVMLISWHLRDLSIIEDFNDLHVPVITCGRSEVVPAGSSCVSADDRAGGAEMTRYLMSLGRKRIVIIKGPPDSVGANERYEGYVEALGGKVRKRDTASGDWSKASGAAAMRRLLRSAPDLDAVFAGNDAMAAGAIEVLQEAGRSVPREVAVGGFDDSASAVQCDPRLTTMRQPFDQITRAMARLMTDLVDGHAPAQLVFRTTLVGRDSA